MKLLTLLAVYVMTEKALSAQHISGSDSSMLGYNKWWNEGSLNHGSQRLRNPDFSSDHPRSERRLKYRTTYEVTESPEEADDEYDELPLKQDKDFSYHGNSFTGINQPTHSAPSSSMYLSFSHGDSYSKEYSHSIIHKTRK